MCAIDEWRAAKARMQQAIREAQELLAAEHRHLQRIKAGEVHRAPGDSGLR